ncbi:MAG: hypothetical protein ACOY3Y_07100, partial [Acidobacteriota bacterium]
MSRALPLVLSLLVLAPACSSNDPPAADAGVDRGSVDRTLRELAAPETGAREAAAPVCPPGLDLKPFTLDAAYCVLYRAPLATAASAVATTANRVWTFASAGTPAGGLLEEHAVKPGGVQLEAASAVFGFPLPATKHYLGTYLARSAGGKLAAGYTEDQTFDGAIYFGAKGGSPVKIEKAQGNYDAIFLDDETLLVNGAGLGAAQEGQGVYLWRAGSAPRRLVKDLGGMSGQLALGPGVLHAGGYFTDGNKLYAFTLAEVKAAIAAGKTLSATSDGDLVYAGGSLDAAALADDLVVAKMNTTTFAVEAVQRIAVTIAGDKVSAGATSTICTPGGALTL